MDFVFLTRSFYTNHASLIEAEQKVERPYTVTIVKVRGCDFAIPLRSHIKHPHALFTDRQKTKGLDLSKAVIIDGLVDIDRSTTPHIDPSEFSFLKGKEFILTGVRTFSWTTYAAYPRLIRYSTGLNPPSDILTL
jgi:protein AbiQ